jgi:hypothetical protein
VSEPETLALLAALERASVWSGANIDQIAAAAAQNGQTGLRGSRLSRALTAARTAGLVQFGPVFGFRCWWLTVAGRELLARSRQITGDGR